MKGNLLNVKNKSLFGKKIFLSNALLRLKFSYILNYCSNQRLNKSKFDLCKKVSTFYKMIFVVKYFADII